MRTIKDLLDTLPQQGTVEWIGIRPERRKAMISLAKVVVSTDTGIEGDRYKGSSGQRQVTLIQEEHLAAIASCSGNQTVNPCDLRRNLVVRGINLLALKNRTISVGDVQLEITGVCHPCSRMEETLGAGGYNAMRGHGGMTARVLMHGRILIDDVVRVIV